jgi:ferredoxin
VHVLRSHSITGEQLPKYGSAGLVSATNATNTLPTRNFQKSHFEFAEEISGEHLADKYLLTNDGCSSCPIRCARVVKHDGKAVKGPEFETVGMFGSNIDNRDLPNILEWNWLADQLAMDTISLGSTLATAMELKQQGRFPELPVSFGHFEGMEQLMRDIAHRRGIGDELAEGSFRLAIRRGDPELSMHAKGMEFAAYDPRGAVGHGLGYATANRGGCHINGGYLIFFEALGPVNVDPHTTKGKPELAVFQQNFLEAVSACGGCTFPTYSVVPDLPKCLANAHGTVARLLNKTLQASGFLLHRQGKLKPTSLGFHLPLIPHTNAIEALTGMRMKLGTFTAVGERGFTLERLFNLREGMTTRDDSLPRRLTHEPQDPKRPETVVPLAEMLPVYYEVRDWDAKGVPTPALVSKLSLDFARPLVDELQADPDARVGIRRGWLDRGDVVIQRLLIESRRVAEDSAQRRDELERDFDRAQATEWAARVRRAEFRIDPARCRKCGICAGKCPVGAITWERGGLAAIDPAKCIRCGVCAQVCPPHFDAVVMPDAPADADRSNVRYRVIEDKCRQCGACFKPCPVGAIAWKIKEKAVVDADLCVACGRCFQKCPTKFAAIEKVEVAG